MAIIVKLCHALQSKIISQRPSYDANETSWVLYISSSSRLQCPNIMSRLYYLKDALWHGQRLIKATRFFHMALIFLSCKWSCRARPFSCSQCKPKTYTVSGTKWGIDDPRALIRPVLISRHNTKSSLDYRVGFQWGYTYAGSLSYCKFNPFTPKWSISNFPCRFTK